MSGDWIGTVSPEHNSILELNIGGVRGYSGQGFRSPVIGQSGQTSRIFTFSVSPACSSVDVRYASSFSEWLSGKTGHSLKFVLPLPFCVTEIKVRVLQRSGKTVPLNE